MKDDSVSPGPGARCVIPFYVRRNPFVAAILLTILACIYAAMVIQELAVVPGGIVCALVVLDMISSLIIHVKDGVVTIRKVPLLLPFCSRRLQQSEINAVVMSVTGVQRRSLEQNHQARFRQLHLRRPVAGDVALIRSGAFPGAMQRAAAGLATVLGVPLVDTSQRDRARLG